MITLLGEASKPCTFLPPFYVQLKSESFYMQLKSERKELLFFFFFFFFGGGGGGGGGGCGGGGYFLLLSVDPFFKGFIVWGRKQFVTKVVPLCNNGRKTWSASIHLK